MTTNTMIMGLKDYTMITPPSDYYAGRNNGIYNVSFPDPLPHGINLVSFPDPQNFCDSDSMFFKIRFFFYSEEGCHR